VWEQSNALNAIHIQVPNGSWSFRDNVGDYHADFAHRLEGLVDAYFSVSDAEKILIDDTLAIYQPSIHRSNLDADIPSLAFPDEIERKNYADTLSGVLTSRTRKQGIKIRVEAMASKALNLVFVTVVFGNTHRPYSEIRDEAKLWAALDRVGDAAKRTNGTFSYLRGFSYFEQDRLHMLKPGTMKNWCRSAALNDADAIFEHLVREQSA
jgi:hypothetical protein